MKIKLWPSGHSDDYDVVAEYDSREDAAFVANRLIRTLRNKLTRPNGQFSNGAAVERAGKIVVLSVYEGGQSGERVTMPKSFHARTPVSVDDEEYRSAVSLTVDLPGPTVESSMLVFSQREGKMLSWLLKNAEVRRRGSRLFIDYVGEDLFYSDYDDSLDFNETTNVESLSMKNSPGWRLRDDSFRRAW